MGKRSGPPVASVGWIRNPSDDLAVAAGCWFDPAAAERPITFIERFCRQSKGRWAGKPLRLLEWQRDFIRRLFGWRRPDGTRRFRSAYLEVGKKNGKSTMLSAIVIFLMLADGEGAPEVYLNAVDRDQASIVFDEAARMVRSSPELARRLEVVDSRKRIVDPKGNGVLRANSCDAPKQDGLNPSAAVFDELHRQRDRQLWDVFEFAGASRSQPLKISITTAGEDERGIWFEQRDYSERINAGTVEDWTHLGVVYRAPEDADLDDPATWRAANPSLGETISVESFAEDLMRAKESPVKLALFKRLRLNVITRTQPRFIDPARWKQCGGEVDAKRLIGSPCYGGLDLAQTRDLASFVVLFPADDETFDVAAWHFAPELGTWRDNPKVAQQYTEWARAGWLTLTDGESIDYGFVEATVVEVFESYELRKLLADRAFANQLLTRLRDVHGVPAESIPQTGICLNEPIITLERLVLGRKFRHGGNPVLSYCVTNAVAKRGPTGLLTIGKPEGGGAIDGAAALINALAAATASGPGVREGNLDDVVAFL
jgi:phage terminase large subunit-like protein